MKTEAKGNISKVLCVAAAFVSTLALNCRWSFEGGSEGGFVLSFLQKFGIAFNGVDFADIIIVLALSFFYLNIFGVRVLICRH